MGEKLANFVAAGAKILNTFVENSAAYLEKTANIVQGDNPSLYSDAMEALDILRVPIEPRADLRGYIAVFTSIDRAISSMRILMKVLENETYAKRLAYNMSSTFVESSLNPRGKALAAFTNYISLPDTGVIEETIAMFTPDDIYSVLTDELEVNKFTIKLLSHAMSIFKGEKKETIHRIVEKQKDAALHSHRHKLQFPGAQALTSRCGLIPSPSIEAPQDWAALAGEGKGIIVINMSIGTPVFFDLRGLIDAKYIAEFGLKTAPLAGVNKKVIERFNTASMLEGSADLAPPIQIFPGAESGWRVFQILAAGKVRECGGNGDSIPLGLNGRPHSYGKIQSEVILSHCFDPAASTIAAEYENFKASTASSEVIRAAIADKLVERFIRSIGDAVDLNTVTAAVGNSNIVGEILVDTLVTSTGLRGRKTAEHILTYLAKFDGTTRAFMKEIEKRWAAAGVARGIFSEYKGAALVRYLSDTYSAVVKAALLELDKIGAWSEYDLSVKEYFLDKKLI